MRRSLGGELPRICATSNWWITRKRGSALSSSERIVGNPELSPLVLGRLRSHCTNISSKVTFCMSSGLVATNLSWVARDYVRIREKKYRPARVNTVSGDHAATAAGKRLMSPICSAKRLRAT